MSSTTLGTGIKQSKERQTLCLHETYILDVENNYNASKEIKCNENENTEKE